MRYLTLTITGIPKATPRPRSAVRQAKGKQKAVARSYMPPEYVEWKQRNVALLAGQIAAQDWQWMKDGARVSIEVVFPRPATRPKSINPTEWKAGTRVRRLSKPDCDNLWKGAVDAMTVAINEQLGFAEWDDCMAEFGQSNRWYGAIGEEPFMRLHVEPLDTMPELIADLQRANQHKYPDEARRALRALEQYIPAGDMRWQTLIPTAEKLGVNIPLTA